MPSATDKQRIAVIGGGIIGASTAYYLSRDAPANVHVTLIEEAANVAPGASGKSGGFLAEDWHGPDTADLGRLSYRLHRELAEQHGGQRRWGYREVETVSIGFDDSKKRSTNKCPKEIASWIDGQYVTSASHMGGGGTTAQATPQPLVEHLVSEARASGMVDVLCSTRAQRVNVDQQGRVNGLVVRKDGQDTILAVSDVVVAAGPWTGALLKTLLPKEMQKASNFPRFMKQAMRITGSRAHSIVVHAPQPTTAHCLFTDMHYANDFKPVTSRTHSQAAGAPEIYCRGDGTVYACGGSDDVPLPASAAEVDHDPAQTKRLAEQCAALSPSHLSTDAGAKITREQACYLPIAPSGPIIAGDRQTGIYVAAGHSCWGITLGLGTGKVIREMLYNEKLSADVSSLG
jgi:glycine/D-amino acid oxidase-like deaminating enzyme